MEYSKFIDAQGKVILVRRGAKGGQDTYIGSRETAIGTLTICDAKDCLNEPIRRLMLP